MFPFSRTMILEFFWISKLAMNYQRSDRLIFHSNQQKSIITPYTNRAYPQTRRYFKVQYTTKPKHIPFLLFLLPCPKNNISKLVNVLMENYDFSLHQCLRCCISSAEALMVGIEAVPTYPDSYLFRTYIVLGIFGHLKIRFLATFWVILNTVAAPGWE